jgi:hypothetical protein
LNHVAARIEVETGALGSTWERSGDWSQAGWDSPAIRLRVEASTLVILLILNLSRPEVTLQGSVVFQNGTLDASTHPGLLLEESGRYLPSGASAGITFRVKPGVYEFRATGEKPTTTSQSSAEELTLACPGARSGVSLGSPLQLTHAAGRSAPPGVPLSWWSKRACCGRRAVCPCRGVSLTFI